ncbi:MAG: efflux RND transporter periplasmic adaptor subunit [Gemmataceae bacterium]
MSRSRARWLRVLSLAVAMPFVAGCGLNVPKPAELPPPLVQVAHPIEREVTNYQIFTARTQAVESVDVKARVTGYLTKINFKDGDLVQAGDVLFEIDDRPYKADLDQAKGQVEFQQAALVKAQADYDIALNVRKENPVAISVQEVERRLGTRDEAKGGLAAAEGQLEQAELNYFWCRVTAPISGRIDRHYIDVGNLITKDTTSLTTIVSLKPIWAYFYVDQNTVLKVQKLVQQGKLRSARATEVNVQMSLTGGQDFSYNGVIDFVANQLDPNTGSIQVRAVFANEDNLMLAGLFGRIRVPVSEPHQALLVADEAIGVNQGENFVLVVNDDHVVEYRPVTTGQMFDGLREVLPYTTFTETAAGGQQSTRQVPVLKATDRILVNGLQRVRPGATVDPQLIDMQTLMAVKKPASTGN